MPYDYAENGLRLSPGLSTEQPYVMVSKATSLSSLMVLRNFDVRQITKHYSEELRKEFSRFTNLKWRTCGEGAEVEEVKRKSARLAELYMKKGGERVHVLRVNSTKPQGG